MIRKRGVISVFVGVVLIPVVVAIAVDGILVPDFPSQSFGSFSQTFAMIVGGSIGELEIDGFYKPSFDTDKALDRAIRIEHQPQALRPTLGQNLSTSLGQCTEPIFQRASGDARWRNDQPFRWFGIWFENGFGIRHSWPCSCRDGRKGPFLLDQTVGNAHGLRYSARIR